MGFLHILELVVTLCVTLAYRPIVHSHMEWIRSFDRNRRNNRRRGLLLLAVESEANHIGGQEASASADQCTWSDRNASRMRRKHFARPIDQGVCNAPRTEHSVLLLHQRRDARKRREIRQHLTQPDVTGTVSMYPAHCLTLVAPRRT